MSGSDGGAAQPAAPPSPPSEGDFVIHNLEDLLVIEKRINERGNEDIRDRWESGKVLLQERVKPAGRGRPGIPKERMDELVTQLGKDASELRCRMRFAEQYPTEDNFRTVVLKFLTWTQARESMSNKTKPELKGRGAARAELPGGSRNPELVARTRELVESGQAVQAALKAEFNATGGVATAARNYVLGLIEGENKILDATAQQRKDALDAKLRKQLDREYRDKLAAEVAELKAEAAQAVEEYKAQQSAEMEASRERMTAERDKYKTAVAAIKAEHGVFTAREYKTIWSCLHPDSRESVTDEKLESAFLIFTNEKINALLVRGE